MTLKDRAAIAYHALAQTEARQYRKQLESAIQCDATLFVLNERAYYGARRTSYTTLPCFNAHYPNINYPVPAQLLPGVRFQRPEIPYKSVFSTLFGKNIRKSTIVLPVGRKPTAEQLYKHNQCIIDYGEEKANEKVRNVGYQESDSYESDESEEEEKKMKGLPVTNLKLNFESRMSALSEMSDSVASPRASVSVGSSSVHKSMHSSSVHSPRQSILNNSRHHHHHSLTQKAGTGTGTAAAVFSPRNSAHSVSPRSKDDNNTAASSNNNNSHNNNSDSHNNSTAHSPRKHRHRHHKPSGSKFNLLIYSVPLYRNKRYSQIAPI